MSTKIALVGTYPPTDCGIASFTKSLFSELQTLDSCHAEVIRIIDGGNDEVTVDSNSVLSKITNGNPLSIVDSANEINQMDVAIIQHEFGIYGGKDGKEVLELIDGVRIPSIVVLHTVLAKPTPSQRSIIEYLCAKADAVVIMSMVAYARLIDGYEVDSNKINLIPHGARRPDTSQGKSSKNNSRHDGPVILTWGLLGPGKGIEWVIEAMDMLRDLTPTPKYLVVGRTHPKVLERDGERYREGLQRRIEELHLDEIVELRSGYLDKNDLDTLILDSDIVVLPYDSMDQATSGVLIEALNARRPIISTEFSHAIEVLSEGAGRLVPHRNADAIADEIRNILENPQLARAMSTRADEIARGFDWPAVAMQYLELAQFVSQSRLSLR